MFGSHTIKPMHATLEHAATQPPSPPSPVIDKLVLIAIGLALALLYLPSYMKLATTVWSTDEQGHGPIIFAVSMWLFYRHWPALSLLRPEPQKWWSIGLAVISVLFFVLGRSQGSLLLEIASQLLVLAALFLLFVGRQGLKLVWFPLFFLIFMIPLPEPLVAAVTAPLKSAVSSVASDLLYYVGYPVSRVGVILNVGQYQLLVADACAGLNSMFTLEALGLLYMNLMQYKSAARNVVLTILVIPIAFGANIVRVMILVLVTYHFGDAAGQGFVHGFAGMVLFLVGLILVLATDYALGWFFKEKPVAAGEVK